MCRSHQDCHFCHSCCRFLVDCCLTHRCHYSADAFANAAISRHAVASHPLGWLSCGFLSRHNLLTCHRLTTCRLVAVSSFIALPSHLPWLVVTLPLFAPPLPLNVPAAATRRVITSPRIGASNSISLLSRITHPPPAGFSFGRWMPADERTKMGALLGFWSGGGMWCIFNSPEKKIKKYPMFSCCIQFMYPM